MTHDNFDDLFRELYIPAYTVALRRLPRRQREVLVLRYLADMTEVEVAGQLEISRGAVKQHSRRGLARLRELIGSPVEEVPLAC